MPQCFIESFGNQVTVIVDCFEIFIEKPNSVLSRAECWSNYKHHRTLKYLIGITPQGTVAFISEGYGGGASDKFVTEDSGFLKLLVPGSVVLADWGFLIENSVNLLGSQVKLPAFTKGKNLKSHYSLTHKNNLKIFIVYICYITGKSQLHPKDLEDTRSIAHVRIHVERVIGSVQQKYPILSSIVPISILRMKLNFYQQQIQKLFYHLNYLLQCN